MKYATDRMIKQLILHEGCKLSPYRDSLGNWTIGIGRNINRGIGIDLDHFEQWMLNLTASTVTYKTLKITEREARWLCSNDVFQCEKELLLFCPLISTLSEIRQRVLVDMLFNMGQKKLKGFVKFFTALKKKNYELAAEEMLHSVWAVQVGQRATRLAEMMETNCDYEN